MVKPNLKVGDIFEDGGLYYKVLAVEGRNYRSKRVEKPEETPEAPAEEKPKRTKGGNKDKAKEQQTEEPQSVEETPEAPVEGQDKESEGES